jgi:hypothetical protein
MSDNKSIGNYNLLFFKERELHVFAGFMCHHFDKLDGKWKAHVSVANDDLPKSWDLIYPLLLKHKVQHFKVKRQSGWDEKYGLLTNANSGVTTGSNEGINDLLRLKNGMQITIYGLPDREGELKAALSDIEGAPHE